MPSSAPTTRNWSAGLGTGSEVSHLPRPKLGIPRLLLPLYPWPTPGDRVNPCDSSVDPQGAAVEDLGEAGTHLGEARGGKEAQGEWAVGGGAAGRQGRHLRAPWGLGGAHGKTISVREGRSQGQCITPGLPSPQPLCSTPSPRDPPGASQWPRQ